MPCNNCPRNCDKTYFCGKSEKIKINLYSLHTSEEPILIGEKGSGTIFFSCCNLSCVFCQNYKISQMCSGYNIESNDLIRICYELLDLGASNINLVTPTPYIDKIIPVLKKLKKDNFPIPFVLNCGGYESLDMVKKLKGLIDIYLPDFKYSNDDLAKKFSNAPNYLENVLKILKEMRSQVEDIILNGVMKQGLIIRHLVLPGYLDNSKACLLFIREELGRDTYISLMSQFYPTYKAAEYGLDRTLYESEYKEICSFFNNLGFENGFFQDISSNSSSYTPFFK